MLSEHQSIITDGSIRKGILTFFGLIFYFRFYCFYFFASSFSDRPKLHEKNSIFIKVVSILVSSESEQKPKLGATTPKIQLFLQTSRSISANFYQYGWMRCCVDSIKYAVLARAWLRATRDRIEGIEQMSACF